MTSVFIPSPHQAHQIKRWGGCQVAVYNSESGPERSVDIGFDGEQFVVNLRGSDPKSPGCLVTKQMAYYSDEEDARNHAEEWVS